MENPYARELTVKRRCVGVTRTAPRMTYPSAGSYQRAWPKYNPPATPSSVCPETRRYWRPPRGRRPPRRPPLRLFDPPCRPADAAADGASGGTTGPCSSC